MRRVSQSSSGSGRRVGRRGALTWLVRCLAAALGAAVATLCGVFFVSGSRQKGRGRWVAVCRTSDLRGAEPVARRVPVRGVEGWYRFDESRGVFVLGDSDSVRVLSRACTHLGCNVEWNEGDERFLCPCHGGVFAADGSVLAGPPRRPLEELETRVVGSTVEVWVE